MLAAKKLSAKKGRTSWTDNEVRRLVQARTLHNDKFQYHNRNMNQKWDIVTDTFNNGSQQSETNTTYLLDLPLEPEKRRTTEVIKHKFEDILSGPLEATPAVRSNPRPRSARCQVLDTSRVRLDATRCKLDTGTVGVT